MTPKLPPSLSPTDDMSATGRAAATAGSAAGVAAEAPPAALQPAPPLVDLMDVLLDELLLKVLACLDAEDLAQAALACAALARLCRKDELWAPLCRLAWGSKQCAHAFADALAAGEARNAYGLVLRDSWKADTYTTMVVEGSVTAPARFSGSSATCRRSATCTGGCASPNRQAAAAAPTRGRARSSQRNRRG